MFVSALGRIQHICYCDVAFNHLLMRDLTSYFVHVSDISKLMITYYINGQVANRILPNCWCQPFSVELSPMQHSLGPRGALTLSVG